MVELALSVEDLSKTYGDVKAVSHISFEVPRGVVCGFVGPNGSGKTTTIRMLLGLITPTTGQGTVLNESITQPEKYLSSVGAMIEGPAFYPVLSGRENLKVLAKLGGFPVSRVDELLDLVGLLDRGSDKFKTYSLGMKQRLGIAAALLPEPRLLILDEPTNGLDPEGIQEVRDLLRKLANNGTTIFVSSHLLSELELISDYLVILRKGHLMFSGTIDELFNQTKPTLVIKPEWQEDFSKLENLIKERGHSYRIESGTLHVGVGAQAAAEINRAAFQEGIALAELTPRLPSLEETFFEMTGE